jgi:hypothetical protein
MHPGTWMGGAVLALLAASDAFAAEGAPSGPSEPIFFVQIRHLLVVGRLLGEAMQRIGQPAVMGQLVAGMVLGRSVVGALWPDLQHAIFPGSQGAHDLRGSFPPVKGPQSRGDPPRDRRCQDEARPNDRRKSTNRCQR